jgi:hypothetical protein
MNALLRDPLVRIFMARYTKVSGIGLNEFGELAAMRYVAIGADSIRKWGVHILTRKERLLIGMTVEAKSIHFFGQKLICHFPVTLVAIRTIFLGRLMLRGLSQVCADVLMAAQTECIFRLNE